MVSFYIQFCVFVVLLFLMMTSDMSQVIAAHVLAMVFFIWHGNFLHEAIS